MPPPLPPHVKLDPLSSAVLRKASREARRHGHVYTGTEDLLLGLLGVGDRATSEVLSALHVEEGTVTKQVNDTLASSVRRPSSEPSFTPRAVRVIDLAAAAARLAQRPKIQPTDILSGLIAESEGVAARVLASNGVSYDALAELLSLPSQTTLMEEAGRLTPSSGHPDFRPAFHFATQLAEWANSNHGLVALLGAVTAAAGLAIALMR